MNRLTLAIFALCVVSNTYAQYGGYGKGYGGYGRGYGGYGGYEGGKEIAKEMGFEKGLEIGKEVGKEVGLEVGKEVGLEEGKEIGIEKGKEIGIEKGKEIGLEKGFEKEIELEKGIGYGGGYGGYGGIGGGHLGYGRPGWEGHPGAKIPLVNVIKKHELIYNPIIKKVPFIVEKPIIKLPAYRPKFDVTPFLKPAQVIVDDYVPPIQKIIAPPTYITRKPIKKEIIQDIFIKQPIEVTKIQKIHKKEQVNVIKGPAIVEEEKVPVVELKPEIDVKPVGPIGLGGGIGPIGGYAAKARRGI